MNNEPVTYWEKRSSINEFTLYELVKIIRAYNPGMTSALDNLMYVRDGELDIIDDELKVKT